MVNKPEKYDFGGWATRFNIKCSDGRTIKPGAFDLAHGQRVPLVWNHDHKDPDNILGHAILEKRDDGIYAYGLFNETEEGKRAKELVKHKDITSLSIYANKLKHNGKDVIHGMIRELSLVLAGANMGAYIDTVLVHGEGEHMEEDATIYNPSEGLELKHADTSDENPTPKKEQDPQPEPQPEPQPKKEATKEDSEMAEKTVKDVFDEFTKEQQDVVYAMIGLALEEANKNKENEGDQPNMKHNLFEGDQDQNEDVLTHAEIQAVFTDAKKGSNNGSLKDNFIAHGITEIENLFPEAQNVTKTPEQIDRDQTWVNKVMNGIKRSPFSRVKSTAVLLTADEARAKGYIKGNQKEAEVISALKRVTTPTTVYKLQKLDRDDVIDITDFDVIAFIKAEMRSKLDEELARAFLIGDGRNFDATDKIQITNIRPILGDSAVYTVPKILERAVDATDAEFAKGFIKDVIKSRKEYKGSGNPTLFTTEDMLTNMLLIEDTNGRVIYETMDKLTTALRVKEIVTVPVMENVVRTDETETFDYLALAVLVNLMDYNVGADKGGAVNLFDDFDLNYNKLEYLIETRCSGALIKPYSAISFELKTAHVNG